MPAPISIYLIRHGESEANLNKSINAIKADHLVELSPRGQDQAVEAGTKLGAILTEPIKGGEVIAAYVSPYNRTRQTWNNVKVGLRGVLGALPAIRERESIYLRELEFGLFDGIADEELSSLFPLEYPHYNKLKQAGGEYYARMPCGESRCDVAQRVHQGFGSIHRDHEKRGVRHAIVVSHGVTIRAFVMMWLGLSPEWMEAEPNPLNCSIRLLSAGKDLGYLHNGRKGHNPARDRREAGKIDSE
jgi:2,3-bisphosphoglycerate-dependent phosphoglycerate mutase